MEVEPGWGAVFFSTFEKPLDSKRRIVVPVEFRTAVAGPFDGVFCFPSVEADCIDGGGKALFDRNEALINELEGGDPLRYSLEFTLRGGMAQLSFDTAGRIQIAVTARHRETVGLAHRRHDLDFDRKIEIGDHLTQHDGLKSSSAICFGSPHWCSFRVGPTTITERPE